MPKKNKPAAKGPFYVFMMEFNEQEEAAGYRFSGLAEVTEKAGPHWEKLAPHEREPYNQRAKQNKANPKEAGGYGERYTAQGKPFSQVQAEAVKRRQLEEQIQKRIVEMIQTASANNALGELEVYVHSAGILEATDLDYVKFSILPLIDFFYNLKLATEDYGLDIKTFPSIHLAKALLEKDVYAYTAGIACDVHEQLNNQVACALSRVVRWAYVISDS
ncbi:hypothetical protein quinque_000602 [Culex quinquefasciatus]